MADLPIIDSEQLSSLRELNQPGEKDFVSELIDIFLQQSPQLLRDLEAAVSRGVPAEIQSLAHKFKGSSANIGAVRLRALCAELETMGRNNQVNEAKALIGKLPAAYKEATGELQSKWYKAS
jgi:HPt (histidine-containing phosphotransfer) domain-containing protein